MLRSSLALAASLAVLALPCAAIAQPAVPAARPATTAAPAPKKIPGLSDAGNALYAKAFGAPDSQLLQISRQQRTLRNALTNMAMGATIDVDKLATMLEQQAALQAQFRTRQTEITIAMLREMTDADRGAYLRYAQAPAATPAAPAK